MLNTQGEPRDGIRLGRVSRMLGPHFSIVRCLPEESFEGG